MSVLVHVDANLRIDMNGNWIGPKVENSDIENRQLPDRQCTTAPNCSMRGNVLKKYNLKKKGINTGTLSGTAIQVVLAVVQFDESFTVAELSVLGPVFRIDVENRDPTSKISSLSKVVVIMLTLFVMTLIACGMSKPKRQPSPLMKITYLFMCTKSSLHI